MPQTTNAPSFAELLHQATPEPGAISQAYSAFHGYSLGNQLLAWAQCDARGIPLGPIATFNRWKELGRYVSKGAKALQLCMPVTCKRPPDEPTPTGEDTATFTRFIYRNNWFVLAQTEGADYEPPALPGWDRTRALAALDIAETAFDLMDGNCQGFARGRSIAVSPVAAMPEKTRFHEIAHVVLGHTAEAELTDDERTARNTREVEAEAVAMLCCAALNMPGIEQARGYIQHWYGTGQPIPEASARKILKTADVILRAGREDHPHEPTPDPVHDPGVAEFPA
jgi:antirestriction protein ArdC